MKLYTVICMFAGILMCVCLGCADDTLDYYHPDVKLFVRQLKNGNYHTTNASGVVDVPRFTQNDIPELLEYADDLSEIPFFPILNMPSQFGGKARLGECMLWVVEGIRIGFAPSQGCRLVTRNADNYESTYFLTNEQVLDAVARYRQWWEDKEEQYWSLKPTALSDPLANSNYRWW